MHEQQIPATVMMPIDMLKPYPRNKEFFRDLEGESYERLKQSIAEKGGLYHPILVAPDMTIVSGHQRWRAAKELGFKMVRVEVDPELVDDDSKMKALFECNWVREASPEEKRRNLLTYVEMFGNKNGGNKKAECLRDTLPFDKIAEAEGVSRKKLFRDLKIQRNLIPELRKIMDSGRVGFNIAADTIASYPEDIQESIVSLLTEERHYSDREIKTAIAQIEREKNGLTAQLEQATADRDMLAHDLESTRADVEALRRELEARPVREERVEVIPTDYDDIKSQVAELKEKNAKLSWKARERDTEAAYLKQRLKEKEAERANPQAQKADRIFTDVCRLESAVRKFLSEQSGRTWFLDYYDELDISDRNRCLKTVMALNDWVQDCIRKLGVVQSEWPSTDDGRMVSAALKPIIDTEIVINEESEEER